MISKRPSILLRNSGHRLFLNRQLILLTIIFFVVACSPQSAPTPFRPPTSIPPIASPLGTQPLATTTSIPAIFTALPTQTIVATLTNSACTNILSFIEDITIEDGTTFFPNTSIDKQWLIQNDGTCDWDSTYKIKWVGGDPLGGTEEQPLYPARAGSQATIRILFTAPAELGEYESAWQAVDPDGNFFGDLIFIKIVVIQ